MGKHSLYEAEFRCSRCGRLYKSVPELKDHAERVHSTSMWKCDYCEYKSERKQDVTRHERHCRRKSDGRHERTVETETVEERDIPQGLEERPGRSAERSKGKRSKRATSDGERDEKERKRQKDEERKEESCPETPKLVMATPPIVRRTQGWPTLQSLTSPGTPIASEAQTPPNTRAEIEMAESEAKEDPRVQTQNYSFEFRLGRGMRLRTTTKVLVYPDGRGLLCEEKEIIKD